MKTRILNIIIALLALPIGVQAQTLSVESVEAEAGKNANIVVNVSGVEAKTTALQFNLSLPSGVTLNESGITMGAAASNHGYEIRSLDSGERLVVVFNINLSAIQNGVLMTLPVTLGSTVGTFNGSLTTVRFADTDAVSKEGSDASIQVTIKEATAIETVTKVQQKEGPWYDLSGRQVTAPNKKGLYITNGTKVVVK